MTLKDTITSVSDNIFPGIKYNQESSAIVGTYEASSNMLLQMLLYLNVFLLPFWFTTTATVLYWKFDNLGHLTQFLGVAVLVMTSAIECLRLYLGYIGNLSERIPELAGFWMLSILLQLPLQSFQLGNPYLQHLPIELTLHTIMLLLLLGQLTTGFIALRNAAARAKQYYSLISKLRKPIQSEIDNDKID